ncbi:porin [Halomonas sp. GFAJ-1]|uniref:porin n=1 Tax=Halomonas sp. GFAJ-1 TaxID=1118153 RepID=UPI00023A41C5|nr:porin [Halomonas sp. GFAJ-1]AVI62901.1 porin [Halomonas sp. GFAJ-1]EHK62022.1 porin Gram-negative type [Halomonas sp. GFAJ-1]
MKKTLLATAIIGALGASAAAQAATVYDQDGTRLDVYGRIAMGIEGGGVPANDGASTSAEFRDVFSRLGLRMSQDVTSDLTAFGHVEWRFQADGGDNRFNAFTETRQSYIGLESNQFGTIQGGNFDSFYNSFVSLPFDVYLNQGLEFQGHPKQSRGDSIGYYTPDLNGFTAALQLKHYSDRGEDLDRDSTVVAAQGGVRYQEGPVTVGLGFIEDVERGEGTGEMIYGLIGSYAIDDQLTLRAGFETQDRNDDPNTAARLAADDRDNGFDSYGLGLTYTTGPWAFNADVYHIDRRGADDSNSWAAGAYYKVSSNFDVFAELYDGDAPSTRDAQIRDFSDDVYWLTGARYLF